MIIYEDTREQKGFSLTETWKDVEVKSTTLKTGDYMIEGLDNSPIIERKAIGDWINCCGKEKARFLRECIRLKEYAGETYLIIEGGIPEMARHLKRVRSRMHINYITHMLKEVHEDYGINVVMCSDREHAAELALYILRNAK